MGEFEFKLPDVGEGIAEAEIVAWHVAVGDQVAEDQPLVDVMTDKATVEITSPVSGEVRGLDGAVGATVAIGSVIAVITLEGAAPGPEAASAPRDPEPPASRPPPRESPAPALALRAPFAPAAGEPRRPLASPSVRRRALEADIRLDLVEGSGPEGRVRHDDLDAFLSGAAVPRVARPPAAAAVEVIPIIGLRRKISERMSEAKRRIPHFSYVEEVDVTALEALRMKLNVLYPQQGKLTVLPFLVRALVQALGRFPQMNAVFDDDRGEIHQHRAVHLGVATQTPNGLVVPVLRHAETMTLWAAAAEIARLAQAARDGKATREELSGSTITITSLGSLGGLATTPVINRPEVAILGPNRIVERPVVIEGQVVVRKMMNLSSSFDHRVIDGWGAAEFIQAIRQLLETPALLFVEPS